VTMTFTQPTHDAIHEYFRDAWDYGLVDFESDTVAFFKVNAADLHEFPELAGVYGLRLTDSTFTEYVNAVEYVAAVAEEAGR
jgi:hypothetical protein